MLKIQKKKKDFFQEIDRKFQEKETQYQDKMMNILEEERQKSILVRTEIKEHLSTLENSPRDNKEKKLIRLFQKNQNQDLNQQAKKLIRVYKEKLNKTQKCLSELFDQTAVIFNDSVSLELVSLKMLNQDLDEKDELNLSIEEENESHNEDLLNSNLSGISKEQIEEFIRDSPTHNSQIRQEFFPVVESQQQSYHNSYMREQNSIQLEAQGTSFNKRKVRKESTLGMGNFQSS